MMSETVFIIEDVSDPDGIGENPITPVAAAIANAVEDAVGVRIRDLPVTAEKVHGALEKK
jgi:CO/xanthine dehydrogenase Mo-binding subunit